LADALARTAAAIAEALAKAAVELLAKVFGDQDGPWGCQVRLWMFLPKTVTTAYAQMSDQISKWGNQLVGQTTYATPGIEVYCVDCYVDLALDVKYSLRIFERQDSSEQYCVGALVSAYTQVIFEFIFGDIATLPLFTWPAASNLFYLFTPTCLGRWVDVPMCQKSAVASLKADSNREIFCSGIYGWTSKTTTSTVITREVKTTSGVAMGTTTETVNVLGRLTATHRVYTLTTTGYATSRVSAGCTGAASAETLASRAVVTSAPVPVPVPAGMDVVERAGISTPSYLKGWNVASLSSACGCLLIAPPGTKETSTTPGGTSTSFSTQWITTSTTIITSNITVETVTRTGVTAIYTTLPAALTQSFPAAQYSLASYIATEEFIWSVDGCGVEKEIAGVKVRSGVVDFTTQGWLEWGYEYNYTELAVDYQGDPLTFHRMLEGSGVNYFWYLDDGSTIGFNWNYTIAT
ncbi:hypothetical protein TWF594_008539, partial [Orbilia oligospora]